MYLLGARCATDRAKDDFPIPGHPVTRTNFPEVSSRFRTSTSQGCRPAHASSLGNRRQGTENASGGAVRWPVRGAPPVAADARKPGLLLSSPHTCKSRAIPCPGRRTSRNIPPVWRARSISCWRVQSGVPLLVMNLVARNSVAFSAHSKSFTTIRIAVTTNPSWPPGVLVISSANMLPRNQSPQPPQSSNWVGLR